MSLPKILDAYELAQQLRQEQLLISNEKQAFCSLSEEFCLLSSDIYKVSAISGPGNGNAN